MKKVIFALIAIVIIALIVVGIRNLYSNNNFSLTKPKAIIQKQSFNLILAKSDKEKQIGLSDKESLPKDTAMLFKFDKPGYYSFWMKNMHFPIDIIFIKNNKIVTIYNDAKPATNNKELAVYQPLEEADSVLEINAGLAKEYGFEKDMEVKYENLGN